MKTKNITLSVISILFATVIFIPFLSIMRPLFPLVIGILLFFLGIVFLFKINKILYLILILLTTISIFYLIFPFKVEFIQQNDYYVKFFKDKANKIAIVPIKPSLILIEDIDKSDHEKDYIEGSDVVSLIDPKYIILVRKN